MRIAIVCGAGASSTFLAHRVRAAATGHGADVDARPATLANLDAALADVDVLLIGAHLGDAIDDVRARAAAASVVVAVLPGGPQAARDGEGALRLALAAAGARRGAPETEQTR